MDIENMDISPELQEKAKACTSPEELMELAKREGYKLTETELESVSGGAWISCDYSCDDAFCECPRATLGDARKGIDPEKAHDGFVNGIVDGGELDQRAIDFTVLTRTSLERLGVVRVVVGEGEYRLGQAKKHRMEYRLLGKGFEAGKGLRDPDAALRP